MYPVYQFTASLSCVKCHVPRITFVLIARWQWAGALEGRGAGEGQGGILATFAPPAVSLLSVICLLS
jgi:hypothetical protein